MTLLAAFKILLHRYTGQEDIVVGAPIAGRDRIETETLIGIFINTLVLRTYVDSKLTFLQLLATVRKVAIEAYEHQGIPFEKLVEELQPDRDLSHTPLFQVLFQLRNVPNETVEVQGLKFEDFQFDRGITAFDLTLDIVDTPEGLSCRFEYNTDLFDVATIVRMAGHFQTLLEGIVANVEHPIGQLPLLTEAERHQLLVEWNNTQTDYPNQTCIHQLFEAQVERTPNAVAVVFENEQLTYQQLNYRANQLAHHLQKLGVEPEMLVGICVERSLEMIVGLLGILKAGGAYVPLDPAYPPERLAFMLEDAQVRVLLTQARLVESLPQHQGPIVCLDTDWEIIERQSEENPGYSLTPENLAYVIYTSGSTGRPKGVLIEHRALLNLVFWHQETFSVSSTDRATQIAGSAFDASVWELWPYFSAGASIYIANEQIRISPKYLQEWLVSNAITISFLPTTLAESVLLFDWPDDVSLRILLTGGDKLHNYSLPELSVKLVNNYGPTENTVVTTSCVIPAREKNDTAPPIGQPIANTQVYLLDGQLQLVPIGVPGELYIGGAGLARGYLNSPDLTEEKFIPNPFPRSKGAGDTGSKRAKEEQSSNPERLYKTGDLARYLPDGNIEFLGRIDNQVKIRGFRIELGEVESTLSQYPAVRQCAVIARIDTDSDKRLVAYIVADQQQKPTTDELRRFLKQKLPDYMVPSAFVFLDTIPLTPNGKVDHRALPAPDQSRPDQSVKFVAPRTPIEQQLSSQTKLITQTTNMI